MTARIPIIGINYINYWCNCTSWGGTKIKTWESSECEPKWVLVVFLFFRMMCTWSRRTRKLEHQSRLCWTCWKSPLSRMVLLSNKVQCSQCYMYTHRVDSCCFWKSLWKQEKYLWYREFKILFQKWNSNTKYLVIVICAFRRWLYSRSLLFWSHLLPKIRDFTLQEVTVLLSRYSRDPTQLISEKPTQLFFHLVTMA